MGGRDPFFIGWAPAPRGLRGFLVAIAFGLVAVFGAVGYLIAATANDPGDGAFRFDWGTQSVTGVLETEPYPMLHVTRSDRFPAGHTLMLSGAGKIGAQDRATPLAGKLVSAKGVVLKRGDLDMLQLAGGPDGLVAAEGTAVQALTTPLGRWRLTGEICDGKCYAGAMRPGEGLAHRACANLCLIGGVPPVFVSTAAIEGQEFLLLGDGDGGPVTDALLDSTAVLVEVEGAVERRGDLLVFLIDPTTLQRAQ